LQIVINPYTGGHRYERVAEGSLQRETEWEIRFLREAKRLSGARQSRRDGMKVAQHAKSWVGLVGMKSSPGRDD
jgi:hypothetical protein